jgi:phospholipase C
MIQENRSFDHYFGAMNHYRLNNIKDGTTTITSSDVDTLDSSNLGKGVDVAPNCTSSGCTNVADTSTPLSWSTSGNPTSVTLDGVPQTGTSSTKTPSINTKYVLVASNAFGSAQASFVVGVTPVAGPGMLAGASPEKIATGGTALLSWASGNNSAVTINPPPDPLHPQAYGPNGTAPVKPAATQTYTISNGPSTAQIIVTVATPTPGAPTISRFGTDQGHVSTPAASTVSTFLLKDQCVEDFSPDWLESHGAYNRDNPASKEFLANGFVHIAAGFAQFANSQGDMFHYFEVRGARAMGYFDETILPYYYFMAAQFATADRWFSPVPSNSPPNRLYELGATSHGMVHAKKGGLDSNQNPPIFKRIEDKGGITWKVYYTDLDPTTAGNPPNTTLLNFQPFGNAANAAGHIAPVDCTKPSTPCKAGQTDYFTDLKNGTLPNVVLIEPGFNSGLDEHPGNAVQTGAAYVKSLIDALMVSSAWKDSVFFLTYDEAGGLYDHVKFAPAVKPDGFNPTPFCGNIANCPYSDLEVPGKDSFTMCDPNNPNSGACVTFDHTGFRVPIFIASPFVKKHAVYHEPADNTAILKFIEKRYSLAPLTARDAAQPDITDSLKGIFDFVNVPWKTPPATPPPFVGSQPAPCYSTRLY